MVENLSLYVTGKNKLHLKETKLHMPVKKHEVIVNIKACGICGSDIEFIRHNKLAVGEKAVLGHEIIGTVEGVSVQGRLQQAARSVTINPTLSCNQCFQCKSGRYNLCENMVGYGRDGNAGGYGKKIVVPYEACVDIPDVLSSETGTLIEPLAVCLNAIKSSGFQIGMNAAVIGCGSIGLILVHLLKRSGANKIYACDSRKLSTDFAARFGADYVSNSSETELLNQIRNETNSKGADVVFEASGDREGAELAIKICMGGGKIILLSKPIQLYMNMFYYEIFKKELTLKVVRGFNRCFKEAVDLLKDQLDLKELITHRLGLEEAKEFLEHYDTYKNEVIKAVILP